MKNILRTLQSLRLYQFNGESLVEQELQSYQAGFSMVEQELEDLGLCACVQTCDEQTLARWEWLLRLPSRADVPIQNRREIVLTKLAVSQLDSTLAGVERSIQAVGLRAQIREDPPLGELLLHSAVITGGYDTLDALKRQVFAMLPAHLGAVFDLGVLTWADFDAKDLTFAQLGEWDFTWEWFDMNGDKLQALGKISRSLEI